ncbi:uncharacterized protein I303_107167 [Kwoniella dejecticola CBS 10117]|uniref:RING-type domain-containing protein n=1 Tax=Kwoniella dejecticola CBS 10117 TaxID=1296121 RepID=A0A1A5ZYX4_9TREE|nr:uncharacterized protein I303_06568 [Kwoniella dejecticola CBS 10117]OBR83009.1 hypothetical protein I303_06568 [Kwoniella dejecticola CBS 10117]
MDKIAPFLSKVFGLLAFILFILGNILLFSPLPSTPLSCYHAAPLLWWGVMVVTGVGWFLLAQLLLVVVLVGLGSAVVVAILAKIGIEANTSLQARSSTVSRLSPLTLAELHALQYVCYIPSTSREHFPVENLPHPAIYLDDQKNTCGICQDTFVPPQYGKEQLAQWLIELKCGHVYHAKCIDEWLIKGSATCPFCQRSVRDVVDPSSAGGSQGSTLVNERRDSAFSTW